MYKLTWIDLKLTCNFCVTHYRKMTCICKRLNIDKMTPATQKMHPCLKNIHIVMHMLKEDIHLSQLHAIFHISFLIFYFMWFTKVFCTSILHCLSLNLRIKHIHCSAAVCFIGSLALRSLEVLRASPVVSIGGGVQARGCGSMGLIGSLTSSKWAQ